MSGLTPSTPSSWWRRFLKACRAHHLKTALAILVLGFALTLAVIDSLIANPMRNWAERTMNSNLNGYRVHIGWVRPHVWKLAFELENVVLVQTTHPDPAVADFGALKFSVVWKELLQFRFAGELTLERPALHINLTQIEEETSNPQSLGDRGWQRAIESIYPIKLDRVEVRDGSLLYLSGGTASKPLQLTKVFMLVRNVRNIAAAKGTYPSPVKLEGVLFDTGKVWFEGRADFLREPHAAAQGGLRLERIPVDRLDPLTQDYQLKTKGGFLSATGFLEYTPESQTAHLGEVLFEDLQVDYVTSKATKAVEKKHIKQVVKLAKSVRNAPQLLLKMDSLKLKNSQIGFENEGTNPPYRLFISKASMDVENLSNQATQVKSAFHARGAFMGSGSTVISGGFRSTASPADFDVRLRLDDAKLPALNGFLQAHEGVDVSAGLFSVYTEIAVRKGRIEGYVKPLIKDLKIYDRKKDEGKPFGKRVKLHVLQFMANIFRNHDTKEVATVIRISGSTDDPKTQGWEIIRKLFGNGLVRGILPGFLGDPKTAPTKSTHPGNLEPHPK